MGCVVYLYLPEPSWKPLLHKFKKRRHPLSTLQWSHPHSNLYTCPLPQPVVHLPAHFRSLAFHWLLHQSARTLSGINTPHPIPSYFIHLPMKMELTEGFETSAISTVTPGNYPKENILQNYICPSTMYWWQYFHLDNLKFMQTGILSPILVKFLKAKKR